MDLNFLFEPDSPLFPHLGPLDLIKMCEVSKTARKAAVPYLKMFESYPETRAHAARFKAWLTSPIETRPNRDFRDDLPEKEDTAGPLRFKAIEQMRSNLLRNIVVLFYRRDYEGEYGEVAFFDDYGAFVAHYKLWYYEHYEPYRDATGGWAVEPFFGFQNSATFYGGRWETSENPMGFSVKEGIPDGSLAVDNYGLCDLFYDRLSPTEVGFVMMHALSSNTRAIYKYTKAVFDHFDSDFQWRLEDEYRDADWQAVSDWYERLKAVSYPQIVDTETE